MPAVTEEEKRSTTNDSKDRQKQKQFSVVEKSRVSKEFKNIPPAEIDSSNTNAVKTRSSASQRNSSLLLSGVSNKNKNVEPDSPVNGESRKSGSSEHEADRSITFIR